MPWDVMTVPGPSRSISYAANAPLHNEGSFIERVLRWETGEM